MLFYDETKVRLNSVRLAHKSVCEHIAALDSEAKAENECINALTDKIRGVLSNAYEYVTRAGFSSELEAVRAIVGVSVMSSSPYEVTMAHNVMKELPSLLDELSLAQSRIDELNRKRTELNIILSDLNKNAIEPLTAELEKIDSIRRELEPSMGVIK